MKLLTTGNPKIAKGEKRGYLTAILHLAPAKLSGFNVCPKATKGCAAACLNTAGRGGMTTIQAARIRKTRAMMGRDTRADFLRDLVADVDSHIRTSRKRGLIPVFRLNGTSDLRWETMPVYRDGTRYPHIFAAFPDVQFYDYTKLTNRRVEGIANYHLTFSRADGNDADAEAALDAGMSVAWVVRDPKRPTARRVSYPAEYRGRPVVDGDESDLRFLDPPGAIVMLRAKGKACHDTSGFVTDVEGIAS